MDSCVIYRLFDAVHQKDVEIVRQLLDEHEIDVNAEFYGRIPRFNPAVVEAMDSREWRLRGGFSTLLSQAVAGGDLPMVNLLLDYKADLTAKVSGVFAQQIDIIRLAAQVSHEGIITCLSRRGAVQSGTCENGYTCESVIRMRMWHGTLNPLGFGYQYHYLCPPQWSPIDHFRMPQNMRIAVESIAVARDVSTASVLRIVPNELLFLVYVLL